MSNIKHNIDLDHWKLTVPVVTKIPGRSCAISINQPQLSNYNSDETTKSFMYDDLSDGSLVFHTRPGTNTPGSPYSRTELREQIIPGNDFANWNFCTRGQMTLTFKVEDVSSVRDTEGENKHKVALKVGDPHRIIVAQVHGRLTNEQGEALGKEWDERDFLPPLKIYWTNGRIYTETKQLLDTSLPNSELIHKKYWKSRYNSFEEEVGYSKVKIDIECTSKFIKVTLNDKESIVFDDDSVTRWHIFENYFKAGNYLITRDHLAYSSVKFYDLQVTHFIQ